MAASVWRKGNHFPTTAALNFISDSCVLVYLRIFFLARAANTRCDEHPWIRLPTFISEAFHIPSPACRCQRICRRGAAAVPAAVRRVCTERQLTGSWPLWFAGPEREAAWVYSTLLQRVTMSIFRSGPQEVVLYDYCRRVRAVSECN